MIKSLSCYFLFFLLWGPVSAIGQDSGDSVVTNRTIGSDTTVANSTDAENAVDSQYASLYQPVADSLFIPTGQMREVPEKQVYRYKKSPDYAYANDPQYWRKEIPQEPGFLSKVLFSRTLWWILLTFLATLMLYGIYQLAKENNFSLLVRKRNPGVTGTDDRVTEETLDLDEAIRRNQSEGNYRMAIRFLYLRLIRILKDKGGISFSDSSTNAEITSAMGKHPQATNFRWLATAYEYTFYGGFHPTREIYETLKNEFEAFQKMLSD
jgi:hypothetical protein